MAKLTRAAAVGDQFRQNLHAIFEETADLKREDMHMEQWRKRFADIDDLSAGCRGLACVQAAQGAEAQAQEQGPEAQEQEEPEGEQEVLQAQEEEAAALQLIRLGVFLGLGLS